MTGERRRKRNKETDDEKLKALKEELAPYIAWKDKGILKELGDLHEVLAPSKAVLLGIATVVSSEHDIELPRHVRRNRDLLIGWLNRNFDSYRNEIHECALFGQSGASDPGGRLKGYVEEHPEDKAAAAALKQCKPRK
jgi:hypothetical protein